MSLYTVGSEKSLYECCWRHFLTSISALSLPEMDLWEGTHKNLIKLNKFLYQSICYDLRIPKKVLFAVFDQVDKVLLGWGDGRPIRPQTNRLQPRFLAQLLAQIQEIFIPIHALKKLSKYPRALVLNIFSSTLYKQSFMFAHLWCDLWKTATCTKFHIWISKFLCSVLGIYLLYNTHTSTKC